MDSWVRTGRNEKGLALPLVLLALVVLSGALVAFVSMAGMESLIGQNHDSSTRALHIAEAGLELAGSQVASSPTWHDAFSNLSLPGLIKEYSTASNAPDASVADWSTTPPSPLSNAKRIRWRGLGLASGAYTVMGASVKDNGSSLGSGQVRILAVGYVPNATSPQASRTIEALFIEQGNFLKYGFSSTGTVFSDQISFAAQPGGFNNSYNGGPGVFQPALTTGDYSGGNVPTGGGWSSLNPLSSPLRFPRIDFARYASSPNVVNLNAFRDASGIVRLTNSSQITNNTVYYVDGSFFISNIGVDPTVTFIATHDIKNNATQGITAVSGYPLLLAGGYIYMDTDNTNPLRGAIYSDGSHALVADRTYPIDPLWVGHWATPPGDLVYVESHSQITGAVAARIPKGSGLRLFGGGGTTVTYDMNLLSGLPNLYMGNDEKRYTAWREK